MALGWLLDQPVPPPAAAARRLIIAGHPPVAPMLWRHEVSNAVVVSERRGRLTAGQVAALAADLDDLSDEVEIDPALVSTSVLIETARQTGLTVYDAAYLELAERRRLPLATLDDALREAAARVGVKLL